MKKDLIFKDAKLSTCRKYRYTLRRVWDPDKDVLMFIALNPSTADEETDDATVRRIREFADDWGYGGFYLVNLFSFRATKPADLFKEQFPVSDPADPEANDRYLQETADLCNKVVFCWGNEGAADNRFYQVQKMFPEAWCFGITMSGQPKHPLYLPKETTLVPFVQDQPLIKKHEFKSTAE